MPARNFWRAFFCPPFSAFNHPPCTRQKNQPPQCRGTILIDGEDSISPLPRCIKENVMKSKSNIRTHQEPLQFLKNERLDPFKFQYRAIGADIPGFGKHYPSLVLKGPMAGKSGLSTRDSSSHHDPCFWNRGGGRWFHTKRRGGQVGRQRERGLPRVPFKD
jgi:hypothetical protein